MINHIEEPSAKKVRRTLGSEERKRRDAQIYGAWDTGLRLAELKWLYSMPVKKIEAAIARHEKERLK